MVGMADAAEFRSTSDSITYRPREIVDHPSSQQIPIRDAVAAIQQWIHDYEARIAAAIRSGRN